MISRSQQHELVKFEIVNWCHCRSFVFYETYVSSRIVLLWQKRADIDSLLWTLAYNLCSNHCYIHYYNAIIIFYTAPYLIHQYSRIIRFSQWNKSDRTLHSASLENYMRVSCFSFIGSNIQQSWFDAQCACAHCVPLMHAINHWTVAK